MSVSLTNDPGEHHIRMRKIIKQLYPNMQDKAVSYAINKISRWIKKCKIDLYDITLHETEPSTERCSETVADFKVGNNFIYLHTYTD